jgi:hypothetical protein
VLKTLKVAPQAIVVVLYDLLGFDPSAYPEAKKVEEKTTGTATCERCNGAGIVRQKAGSVTVQISCPLCWGSGKSDVKPKPVTMEEVGMLSDFPVNQATAIINGMLKRALHSADVDEETAKRVMDALVDALLQGSYFTLAYFMYQGGGPHGRGYKVKPEPLTPERIAHMNDFVRSKRELAPHEQNEIYARLKKLLERQ